MNFKLLRKNKEVEPKLWDSIYGHFVASKFREKYSQDKTEAVINNYLSDPENVDYMREFEEMQAYRRECKALTRAEMEQ